MSLVVAQVTDSGPRIVADTELTDEFECRRGGYRGVLKAVVLSPDVVVCFAGDVALGLSAIRNLQPMAVERADAEVLEEAFAQFATSARRKVEFLIARAKPAISLAVVKDGRLVKDLQVAWVGDEVAFSRFQRARIEGYSLFSRLSEGLPAGASVCLTLQMAMEAVIKDQEIPSVGGVCASIACTEAEFNYMSSCQVVLERDIAVRDGDNLVDRMALPVQEGGFAVSVVPPASPGVAALGISYPRAQLGVVLLPLQFDSPQIVLDVSPNDFSERVRRELGVELSAPQLQLGRVTGSRGAL